MEWLHYLGAFGSGLFLANFVPHFIHGVSGNKFPTPFANPPGKGLSSATINVLWALFNLLVGYFLFQRSTLATGDTGLLISFFVGIAAISLFASKRFAEKEKE